MTELCTLYLYVVPKVVDASSQVAVLLRDQWKLSEVVPVWLPYPSYPEKMPLFVLG